MPMFRRFAALLFALCLALPAFAQHPQPKEGSWIAKDFRFHSGEVFPEVQTALHDHRLAHERGGAGAARHRRLWHGMLAADFGGELFGPGQPLDASKYYIILPDALGTGKSTRPRTACARNSRATTTTTW
jgi:homoserine O-acetyltransferase